MRRGSVGIRRRRLLKSVVGLLAVAALGVAPAALAQPASPPLTATLKFLTPPPPGGFSPTDPNSKIALILEIENSSGGPVYTTDFLGTDFFRRLFFAFAGGTVINKSEEQIHADSPVFQCLSRKGVLQSPAIPVALAEVLPGPEGEPQVPHFFRQYVIDDARTFYDLTRPGQYTVNARVPLLTFTPSDPTAVFADCDQFADMTVANVAALTGRQEFTIESNSLAFSIAGPPASPNLTALSPALLWVGLAKGADIGISFDLRASVLKNGLQVGTGQLSSVSGGKSGFHNANLNTLALTLTSGPVGVSSGDILSVEVSVRNACTGSGKNSGTARLWFNGDPADSGNKADAGSRFDATVGGASQDYFLRTGSALATTAGTSRTFIDAVVGVKCGPFTPFGTWSIALP